MKSRGAIFSSCGNFRYMLMRDWDVNGRCLVAIMLNPSKADTHKDDSTTSFMTAWAKKQGFGRYIAVNLFALVNTDPTALQSAIDPIGPDNDYYILRALRDTEDVLIAWGTGGRLYRRDEQVLTLIGPRAVFCFGRTADGSPKFPRALGYSVRPEIYQD